MYVNVDNIGLNALQEDAPISATTSTTVHPKSSALKEDLRQRNRSLVVYEVLGLQYFERVPKCYNILGKYCLLLVCSYCGKHMYRLFHNRHCNITIEHYSSKDSTKKFLKQCTRTSIFGIIYLLVARQSIQLLATTQFQTINSFFFATS